MLAKNKGKGKESNVEKETEQKYDDTGFKTNEGQQQGKTKKKVFGYFICAGPHMAKACP